MQSRQVQSLFSRKTSPPMLCLRSLSIAVGLFIATGAQHTAAADMQFGFAKVDITPAEPLRLSGYGSRSVPFEGVETQLWARAMALKVGNAPVQVLVSVDSIGFPAVLTTSILRQLEQSHGLSRERVVLCFSHAHTTPHVSDGLTNIFTDVLTEEQQAKSRQYTNSLAKRVTECVNLAIKDLAPGQLSFGTGSAGFAANRRVLEKGRWTGFGVNPAGPVDHSVPVLKIVGSDGALRGIVFNYASHCTTLGPDFNRTCGDWAGYAASNLERAHPESVALCTIGCGGDMNPEPRGELAMAQRHGQTLAAAVEKVLADPMEEIHGDLTPSFGYAGLHVDRPTLDELRARATHERPQYRRHAENMLAVQARMGRLPETYPMGITTWQFGDDLTMVFLSGEVVVDYALRLKRELPGKHQWITAYANDVFAYVASERIRREGGYEVDRSAIYYNQPGPWAAGTEDIVITRVHEILANPQAEGALDPQAALKTFHLAAGFEIELVAAEPLITDPVSFAFGADGKLWVVQMSDYPRGIDGSGTGGSGSGGSGSGGSGSGGSGSGGSGKAGGEVRVLEDTDRDGKFDKSTVFLDDLSLPNGIIPWKNGVLITSVPHVLYAEDTNGDGRADVRRVLYSGFEASNPQHRINGFTYGLDNWLYLASGDSGGEIRSEITGQTVNLSGRDLRIQPETGALETVSGRTQFGRNRNDWGDWFGNNNSRPMYHYVISDRYLKRNRHVAAPSPQSQLLSPPTAPRVYPTSRTVDRFNDVFAANRFTSACSSMIFRDTSLGAEVAGAAFICEPVHNLLHRAVVIPDGVTFRAERHPTETESEFLSSSDVWCRPVKVATGPDGALWLADMYRKVIEHPQWIPEDWQKQLNLRAGADKGRIYRIYRRNARPQALPVLAGLTGEELVERLSSANGWQRDTAQQLLIERQDTTVVPSLIAAANAKSPLGRLHALCTLDGLNTLSSDVLLAALSDTDSRVVRRAILLCEPRLAGDPQLGQRLAQLVHHEDMRVRYQLALSLGEWEDPAAGIALGQLAVRDTNDHWLRTAILSSAAKHAVSIITELAAVPAPDAAWSELVQQLIATALGEDRDGALPQILSTITAQQPGGVQAWQIAALTSFLKAISRQNLSLAELRKRNAAELAPRLQAADQIIAAAREQVSKNQGTLEQRTHSIALLARVGVDNKDDFALLAKQLKPQVAAPLQSATVAALGESGDQRAPELLLRGWRGHSPRLQAEILNTLLSRGAWTALLLDALQEKRVQAFDMDATTRARLIEHRNESIRQRAGKLLAAAQTPSRQQALTAYEPVLELPGDWVAGVEVFSRRCAVCHQFRGLGNDIGANLAALKDKSTRSLLTAVLDPNRAVEGKYRNYVAVTTNGRIYNGMVVEESGNSLTLARPDGRRDVILRSDLEEFSNTGKSFMPEGLEKDVNSQQMADVMAFLQSQTSVIGKNDDVAIDSPTVSPQVLVALRLTDNLPQANRRMTNSWLGKAEEVYSFPGPGDNNLNWFLPAVTGDGASVDKYVFRVPIAMNGQPRPDVAFQLLVNDEASVDLPLRHADFAVTDVDQELTVHYLAVKAGEDSSQGFLRIEVASRRITPGKLVELQIAPPTTGHKCELGVFLIK